MRYLFGCTAAILLALGIGVSAQTEPQYPPKDPTPSALAQPGSVTVEGCLLREEDVPGRKPSVAERAGMMEDYVLTSATIVKGSTSASGATAPKPSETPIGTSGSQQMYDVKGIDDAQLKPLVGRRVQIEGIIATVAPPAAMPDPQTGATPRASNDIPDIRGTVIRQVSGDCPAK